MRCTKDGKITSVLLTLAGLFLLLAASCAGGTETAEPKEKAELGTGAVDPEDATSPFTDHDGDGIPDWKDDDDDNDGFPDELELKRGTSPRNYFDRPEEQSAGDS
jgi:hypothetical protein